MVTLTQVLRNTSDPRNIRSGAVVSINTSTMVAVVQLDDNIRVEVPVIRSVANVKVGDNALLIRDRHRFVCIGVFGPTPTVNPPPPVEPDKPTSSRPVTITLNPFVTNSTRPGTSASVPGDALVQGDWTGRYGKAFGQAYYKTPNLSGVTVTSCKIQLKRADGGVFAAQVPTLHRLSNNGITNSPNSQGSTAGPALKVGEQRSFSLPNSWGAALLAGTTKGIGIWVDSSSPYVRLHGRSSWGPTMSVTIRYTTEN